MPHNLLKFSLLKVSITYEHLNCSIEYIKVYSGPTPVHPVLFQLCGEHDVLQQQTHRISKSNVLIEYHSAQFNLDTKFNITIQSVANYCGGNIEADKTIINSPVNGTTGKYPNQMECTWDISVPIGYVVAVQFTERFFIEKSENCTKDYLAIIDNTNSREIAILCGRTVPNEILVSTRNSMRLIFRSDNNIVGDGFTVVVNKYCTGLYYATEQVESITLSDSDNTGECEYIIQAPHKTSIIKLEVTRLLFIDQDDYCSKGQLQIFNTGNSSAEPTNLVGTYCNINGKILHRYPNILKLKICVPKSENGVPKNVIFSFNYSIDDCGGMINKSTEINIHGMEFNTKCIWTILAPSDKKIVIRIEVLDLESSVNCEQSYVKMHEGSEQIYEEKVKLCGNLTTFTSPINIRRNSALVIFKVGHKEASTPNRFKALVLFVPRCDQNIFLSPLKNRVATIYDVSSETSERLDCHFSISAPAGYSLLVQFNSFHLSTCDTVNPLTCECDFVELRDGFGPFANLIDRFCGNIIPRNITSSGSAIWIRFVSGNFKVYFMFMHQLIIFDIL